jgi:aminoglycoside phosphotransferase (APT) family kinase protein
VTRRTALRLVLDQSREVPALVARTMVAIHALDAAPVAAALSHPRVVGSALDWLYSRASALGDGPLIERAQRLLATRPRFTGAVLCHGDLHPLNILRSPGRDTVIDWTHAQYDDPLYDVAFTHVALTTVPVPAPAIARPMIAASGRALAHRFLTQYEHESETTVDRERLAWFERVIVLRIYVEAAEWRQAHPEGETSLNAATRYVKVFERHLR